MILNHLSNSQLIAMIRNYTLLLSIYKQSESIESASYKNIANFKQQCEVELAKRNGQVVE